MLNKNQDMSFVGGAIYLFVSFFVYFNYFFLIKKQLLFYFFVHFNFFVLIKKQLVSDNAFINL